MFPCLPPRLTIASTQERQNTNLRRLSLHEYITTNARGIGVGTRSPLYTHMLVHNLDIHTHA